MCKTYVKSLKISKCNRSVFIVTVDINNNNKVTQVTKMKIKDFKELLNNNYIIEKHSETEGYLMTNKSIAIDGIEYFRYNN